MYESHTMPGVDSMHNLYYLDGILKLFEKKIASFSGQIFSALNAMVTCSVTEHFIYDHNGSRLTQRGRPPWQGGSRTVAGLLMLEKVLSCLWDYFPDYENNIVLLKSICVSPTFSELQPGACVDNDRYSTLQPSKLPPGAWKTHATFLDIPCALERANSRLRTDFGSDKSPSVVKTPTLSHCIHRLLVFYIHAALGHTRMKMSTVLSKFFEESDDKKVEGNANGKSTGAAIGIGKGSVRGEAGKLVSDTFMDLYREMTENPEEVTVFSEEATVNVDPEASEDASHAVDWGRFGLFNTTEMIDVIFRPKALDDVPVDEVHSAAGASFWDFFALIMGTRTQHVVHMDATWTACLAEFSRRYQYGIPIHRTWKGTRLGVAPAIRDGPADDDPDAQTVARYSINDAETLLWRDEVAQRSAKENVFAAPPDLEASPIVQRLQLVQFCSMFRHVGAVTEMSLSGRLAGSLGERFATWQARYEHINIPPLLRRMPATSESLNQMAQLVVHLQDLELQESEKKEAARRQTFGSRKSSVESVIAAADAVPGSGYNPIFYGEDDTSRSSKRRSSTNGSLAGSSAPLTPSPQYLRWQVSHAAILSDIRSFKAANPIASVGEFKAFYSTIFPMEFASFRVEDWGAIWEAAEPLPASEQRPIFKASTEAEKCLANLELVPLLEVARELLVSAMGSVYCMIWNELEPFIGEQMHKGNHQADEGDEEDDGDAAVDMATIEYLCSELDLLRDDIKEATSATEDDDLADAPVSHCRKMLHVVDRVAGRLQQLEAFTVRMHELSSVVALPVDMGSVMLSRLAHTGAAAPTTELEASALLDLARFISSGMQEREGKWQGSSSDAGGLGRGHAHSHRELGHPASKWFAVECPSRSSVTGAKAAGGVEGSSGGTGTGSGLSTNSRRAYQQKKRQNEEELWAVKRGSHKLHVEIKNDTLTAMLKVVESESE
jgi:hypothetical protein